MNLTLSEQLLYAVFKITTYDESGDPLEVGTGYFFIFNKNGASGTPVIITSYHLVENAKKIKIVLCKKDTSNMPNDLEHCKLELEISKDYICLRGVDTDLCALVLRNSELLNSNSIFYKAFSPSHLLNTTKLSALENILIVGCPEGFMDEVNNKPLMRKGITATHPLKDYENKKMFLIDAPCPKGTSGSPAVILNEGNYSNETAGITFGGRLYLLGTVQGKKYIEKEINITISGTSEVIKGTFTEDLNLGIVIKSEEILKLENSFKQSEISKQVKSINLEEIEIVDKDLNSGIHMCVI